MNSVKEVKESIRRASFDETINDGEEEGLGDAKEFTAYNFNGLTTQEARDLLLKYGKNELPEKVIPKWLIFLRILWQPMPCMIWIAILIEIAIVNYLDMGILIFIQFGNAFVAFYEENKAGDAVAALKKSLKAVATAKRDGKFQNIEASLLVPGDTVLLCSGSAVPADCRVNHGTIDVDQAALTGESLPVTMYQGDSCKMGSMVVRGEVEGTVEFTGKDTFFGTTAALLGADGKLSNLQVILIRIVIVLVVASITLCSIVLGYVASVTTFSEALSFAVVLMVASIPMAIEIVTTTTLALGSKELVKYGAIVPRLTSIEDMAGMAILCSDKTGTLTLNKMVIQENTPIYKEGETQYSLLRYAAMAAKWKEPPRDALDTLVLNAVDKPSLDIMEQVEFMPFDPIVKRTEGTVKDTKTQKQFKTSKGAPNIILKLTSNQEVIKRCNKDVHELGLRGIRALAVAKTNDNNEWELLGLLTFLDPPRADTAQTIKDAKTYGVEVKMITGDHYLIAKETAKMLNMNDYIKSADGLPLLDKDKKKPANLGKTYGDMCLAADGFAQVYPEHKFLIVEILKELGYKIGMTGDGVNDAPALKAADVGIAVEGATDAAKAAADIVLTEPGLSVIIHGIIIARIIFRRIHNFITYRIAATLQLLVFFFIAVFSFKPESYMPDGWENMPEFQGNSKWPSFFHMPVLLLMLITLLNDISLISIGYDHVTPRQMPEKWNLPVLFIIASVLALVALVSSIILLYICLNSWNVENGLKLSYGQVTTSIYLKVSISDFLTLFSARTGDNYFWTTKPAPFLMFAGCASLTISTIVAISWPSSQLDGIYTEGLVRQPPYWWFIGIWLYCILFWFVQDFAKVGTYYFLEKYNLFGVNNTGKLVMPYSALKYIQDHKEKDLLAAMGHH